MKEIIKSLLVSTKGSLSSKRFCGILGWIIVLSLTIYCTIEQIQAPEITEAIVIASTALLGVDSITNCFRKNAS